MGVPGYRISVHNSLTTPVLLNGAPRKFAILNWTLGAAVVLGLGAIYFLPLFMIIHGVAVFLAKKDPDFFEVLVRLLRQRRFYRA